MDNENHKTYESLIRWREQDSRRLEQAIDHFNRERAKVENKDILPPRARYDEYRDKIISRRELESTIKALNSATVQNLTSTETLASGEKVSSWEFEDSLRRKNLAGVNLLNELDAINRHRAESGNLGMGEERVSEIQETLALLDDSLDNLENFQKSRQRLKTYGREDMNLYRSKVFMDNFKTAVEGLQNFEHYKLLKEKMNEIKNPEKFYDIMKKSNILMDIFLWYKDPDGALVYSNFDSNEEAFNYALQEELEMDID